MTRRILLGVCVLLIATAALGEEPKLKACIYTIEYGWGERELWNEVNYALYLMGARDITDNGGCEDTYAWVFGPPKYTVTYIATKPITKEEIAKFIDGPGYKVSKANQRIDKLSRRVDELSRTLYELIQKDK